MPKKETDRSVSEQMKTGRERLCMTMDDLARETGYAPEILAKVESGALVPPVSLLLQLSRALKLDMEEAPDGDSVKASRVRARSHRKRVASYAYTPLTKPSADKHLRAYHVTVDAGKEHAGAEYHHDGEEFVYVLRGGIVLRVGDNVYTLNRGESIHFNSALDHRLSNPTGEETKLLVVIYVP